MSFSTTTVSPRIIEYKPPQLLQPCLQQTQKPASIPSRNPPAAGDRAVDESAVPVASSGVFTSEEPAMTQRALEADGTSANPFPVADNDDSSLCDDSDDEDLPPVRDLLNLYTSRSGTVAATEPQTLPERSSPSTTPGKGMHHPCTSVEDDQSRAQESRDRESSSVAQESDKEGDDTKSTGNASSVQDGDDEDNVEKDEQEDDKKDNKKGGNEEDDENNDDSDGGAQQPEHVPAPEQHGSGSRSTVEVNATNAPAQQKDNAQLEILEGMPEPEPSGVPSNSTSCDDECWDVKRVAGKRTRNGITEYLICWKRTWLPNEDLECDDLVKDFELRRKEIKLEKAPASKRKWPATGGADTTRRSKCRRT